MSTIDPPLGPKEVATLDRFELAVETAASRAAQRVARIHRMRLVRWTFLTAMLTTLIMVIVVWFVWLSPSETNVTRNNALYDCQIFQQEANAMADFVQADITLRSKSLTLNKQQQVLQGYNRLFGKTLVGKLIKESNQIQQDAIDRWRNVDIKQLRSIVGTNCAAHITGG